MSEYIKNFDTWNEVQKQLNSSKRRIFLRNGIYGGRQLV